MKIGIYGGTFDPPHMGHMKSARAAMDVLGLDRLLFIPAKNPPHKALPQDTAPEQARLDMVRLMADGMGLKDRVEVSDMELRRPGEKSYTSDTLRALRGQYPDDELWFLMGSDMFLTLLDWHEPEQILALAHIGAFARTDDDDLDMLAFHAGALERGYGATVRLLPLPEVTEVSSTALRQALESGDGTRALSLLWPPVYGYILKNGLYGARADLRRLDDEQLRAVSYSMVKAKRLAHIRGTEQEAVRLAKRWGADEAHARRAAILHDCTKYLTLEEQLKLCRQYDILIDTLEEKSEKLLHAKTAAALAKSVFGEPSDEVEAIYYHTTAKADMTLLEKIIYLADYIEPNRDFDGVETLRELAYHDLDAAIGKGCAMSVEEIEQRGSPVHPRTREAAEYYGK